MKCTVVVIALLVTYMTSAQTIYFNHLSIDDGLRNGNVRAFVKDYQGFMWIGTEDGLHRYDGQNMKIYRKKENDSTSLGSNYILSLYEDSQRNLWVGTLDGGIYVYRRKHDNFMFIPLPTSGGSPPHVTIRSMTEGKDKYLYVGSEDIYRARVAPPEAISMEKVPFATDTVTSMITRFLAITHDLDSNLLVSVRGVGVIRYDIASGKSERYDIGNVDAMTVHVDRRSGLIWVGTSASGILIFDTANNRRMQIRSGNDSRSLRNDFVPAITSDQSGNIWIVTDNGLSLIPAGIDPFTNLTVRTFLPGDTDYTRIHGTIMKAVYVDDDDKVWVGTMYEGANIYNKYEMNFGTLAIPAGVHGQTTLGNVSALEQDRAGNLWIGLDGGGLYRYRGRLGNDPGLLPEKLRTSERIDKVKSLAVDASDHLWIGTWGGGLFRYRSPQNDLMQITSANDVNFGTEVMSLRTDGLGNLWIGTFDRGLFRYHIRDGYTTKIKGYNPDAKLIDRINVLHVDEHNNVWIGKDIGGLHLLTQGETSYRRITTEHLGIATTVTAISQRPGGPVWIGAPSAGLVRYDPQTRASTVFNEAQGLANSGIHAILQDSLQRVWLSHNAGISSLEPLVQQFSNFTRAHGISANQFNNNSSLTLQNGQMVFGNIHGINFFRPKEFRRHRLAFPIAFTKFFVDNFEEEPGSGVLSSNIILGEKIVLQHDQNSFSVQFAGLHYDFSDDAQYEYMLEGFESTWQRAGTRRLIAYTNLPPGNYTLRVRATDHASNAVSMRQLDIAIVPAWYQTLSFKILMAALAIIGALAFHRLRIQFLIRQKKKLEEKVDVRTRKLSEANQVLQAHLDEINQMNEQLKEHQLEIFEKNKEIQAQNEELLSQHEHIIQQQDKLLQAREELEHINVNLEKTVDARTEQLNNTINNLNKTVFELDRFVYSASHDLSAPLKSINGLVELINMERDQPKIYEYTDYIRQTIVKLETVIRSMVDYARNTHVLVNYEHVRLKELIDEVINELAFWQEATRFNFVNNVPESVQVLTDRARVKTILHNLVSNAIKYRDQHKDANWIRFDTTTTASYWELSIHDNGIGIRREYLDKVFNMYFRATDNSKGSGLGLFIVKETLAKINGTIHVESELGKYTRFVIRAGVA